jgi:beta-glucosidase
VVARGELDASKALDGDNFCVRWTGFLVPPASGEYELTVTANDGARLFVDGQKVVDAWTDTSVARAASGKVTLTAGKEHELRLEYYEDIRDAEVRLGWKLPGAGTPFDEAVAAAEAADVVVFVGGLTAEVEGEEMRVNYPGFAGGDRTDIELPVVQRKLVEALQATGKPVVLVLTTGSALGLRWAQETLPAIVVAWYPGQRGGDAVADVLFGGVNPAGRLPVTFYGSVEDLPGFSDYNMEGRTYRYFRGKPVYPFGHGLSYTRFEYSALKLSRPRLGAKDALEVTAAVKNVGARAGDEVVQLYVRSTGGRGARRRTGRSRLRADRAQAGRAAHGPLPARARARPAALRRDAQGAGRDPRRVRDRARAPRAPTSACSEVHRSTGPQGILRTPSTRTSSCRRRGSRGAGGRSAVPAGRHQGDGREARGRRCRAGRSPGRGRW